MGGRRIGWVRVVMAIVNVAAILVVAYLVLPLPGRDHGAESNSAAAAGVAGREAAQAAATVEPLRSCASLVDDCEKLGGDRCGVAADRIDEAVEDGMISEADAGKWLIRACKAGADDSCRRLAESIESSTDGPEYDDSGVPLPADSLGAQALLAACLAGRSAVCPYWFRVMEKDRRPAFSGDVAGILWGLCQSSETASHCLDAAYWVELYERENGGKLPAVAGVPENMSSSAMYAKACENEFDFACLWTDGPGRLPTALPSGLDAEIAYFEGWRAGDEGDDPEFESREFGRGGVGENDLWNMDTMRWASVHFSDYSLDEDVTYLQDQCARGSGFACAEFGVRMATAPMAGADRAAVTGAWKKACSKGRKTACRLVAEVVTGKGYLPERIRLHRTLSDWCRSGDAESCYYAAVCLADVDGPGITDRNDQEMTVRACNGGFIPACVSLLLNGWLEDYPNHELVAPLESMAWVTDSVLAGGCDEGLADACLYLGAVLADDFADGVATGPEGARYYLGRACDMGLAAGCSRLADLGADVAGGIAASGVRRILARACDMGSDDDCMDLIADAEGGLNGPVDKRLAMSVRLKACDRGNAEMCMNAARMLAGGGASDVRRAAALARKANVLDDLGACRYLSRKNPAVADGEWIPDPPDCETSPEMRRCYMACLAGKFEACTIVSDVWSTGCDNWKAGEAADRIDRMACGMGSGAACWRAADRAFMNSPDMELKPGPILDMYRKACGMGDVAACSDLEYFRNGKDAPAAAAARIRTMRDGCLHGEWTGCRGAGLAVQAGRIRGASDVDARILFGIGCTHRDFESCMELGRMWLDGTGGPADPVVASKLLGEACDNFQGDACRYLAGMALDGALAVESEPGTAADLMWKGCSNGSGDACLKYAEMVRAGVEPVSGEAESAESALMSACQWDSPEGCLEIGDSLRTCFVDDDERGRDAVNYYMYSCDLGLPAGCREYATAMLYGPDGRVDSPFALMVLELACSSGDGEACNLRGYLAVRNGSGDGVSWFRRGCDAADAGRSANACFNLGTQLGASDGRAAAAAFGRACDRGLHMGCAMRTAMLWNDDPVRTAARYAGVIQDLDELCGEKPTIPECTTVQSVAAAAGRPELAHDALVEMDEIRAAYEPGNSLVHRIERLVADTFCGEK